MTGLAVIYGIGGLHGVIGLRPTSATWMLRQCVAVSYLRGGCIGVVKLVVFSTRRARRRNGTFRVAPARRSRRRSRRLVISSMRGGRVAGGGLAVLYAPRDSGR